MGPNDALAVVCVSGLRLWFFIFYISYSLDRTSPTLAVKEAFTKNMFFLCA